MQQTIAAALSANPILTLFVVIGLGYLVGEISLFGFKFGVSGVLFVGLAISSLSPAIALPEFVSSLGLVIFVYAIGIHSGPAFFASFRRQGYRDSLLAVGVLAFGALMAVLLSTLLPLPAPRAAGLFCGALTNTPALAAARERIHEHAVARGVPEEQARVEADQPVVTYSIAYPIGVIGVLICLQLFRRISKTDAQPGEEAAEILVCDYSVTNPGVIGRSVGEVLRLHKDLGFVISRLQHAGSTDLAMSGTVLSEGDIVAVVGDETAHERAQQIFGERSQTRIEEDRSRLDYRRVFVSSKEVVGKRLRDLDLQNALGATITRLRRGDVDVVPAPETRLELGDRIRVLTRRENFANVSRFFGDSIRGTAETDFGSVAIGMVLGALVGMLPIPLPGGSVARLGLAGGPLLVALLLGKMEHTGRITWAIPVSVNITLRQLGLLLFLAAVGTRAGYSFVETVRVNGFQLLAAGAAITFGVVLGMLLVGHLAFRIPCDTLMGLVSGVQTQPACLAYAANLSKTDAPNIAYAGVYPAAMIAKIVLAQLLVS